MTRVALDATPLLGTPTGVGTFTSGLIRALLARSDVEVELFAMSLRGWRQLARVAPSGARLVGRPMPAEVLTRVWSRVDWPDMGLFVGSAVDVVHGTNYVVGPASRAGAVVTVYDLTAVRFPSMVQPASLRYPDLVRRAAARGAVVHVTANAIADDVVDLLGIHRDQIRVVPSGVDVPPNPGDALRGQRLAGSSRYILAVGTVEPRKGFPDLVHAFDAVASARGDGDLGLVFAGPDGWGTEALVDAIDASRHRRHIRRLGRVPEPDLRDLFAGAALLAVPSHYEGFGYPPLEAMAAGTPVVVTRTGSLPEVVGEAGLQVDVGDVEALASAVETLLDDARERDRLVQLGRARVAQFTWQRCAESMARVYQAAAGS